MALAVAFFITKRQEGIEKETRDLLVSKILSCGNAGGNVFLDSNTSRYYCLKKGGKSFAFSP